MDEPGRGLRFRRRSCRTHRRPQGRGPVQAGAGPPHRNRVRSRLRTAPPASIFAPTTTWGWQSSPVDRGRHAGVARVRVRHGRSEFICGTQLPHKRLPRFPGDGGHHPLPHRAFSKAPGAGGRGISDRLHHRRRAPVQGAVPLPTTWRNWRPGSWRRGTAIALATERILDVADLPAICDLAGRHEALAWSTMPSSAPPGEHCASEGAWYITGTLGKALGSGFRPSLRAPDRPMAAAARAPAVLQHPGAGHRAHEPRWSF